MRKLLIGAVAASAVVSMSAVAVAQAPEATLKATVKPVKAGTAKKPRNVRLNFNMKVNKPGTTVQFIELTLPKTLKLSGKGLKRCNPDDLVFVGLDACDGAEAGPRGVATALQGVGDTAVPIKFEVQPFVRSATSLVFFVAGTGGLAVQSPINAPITKKGRKVALEIPPELRRPGGTDASLTGLNQTFYAKRGKSYLVSSTGCKNRKQTFGGRLIFATDRIDRAPAPAPLSTKASARCSK